MNGWMERMDGWMMRWDLSQSCAAGMYALPVLIQYYLLSTAETSEVFSSWSVRYLECKRLPKMPGSSCARGTRQMIIDAKSFGRCAK